MSERRASPDNVPVQPFAARRLGFEDLDGWRDDDHEAALRAFRTTCDLPGWCAPGEAATREPDPRRFFERFFQPVLIGADQPALFTGYYEPELTASLHRSERYRAPIFRPPPDLAPDATWASRAEIETQGLLEGRGLEIAWLEQPVDVFFLQVQGSGRLHLEDGQVLRVGFGGRNNHPYRSIGVELVRRGAIEADRISADAIKQWVRCRPEEGRRLMQHNPSFVFFREVAGLAPECGPLGAMNRPVSAGRSIAVDPAHTPLGAPVWIETSGADPIRRLMVAQDTGAAIRGPQRADIFFGSGEAAGQVAGTIRASGRMVVLMPRADAGTTG